MREQRQLPITASRTTTEPNYRTTAGLLLTACRGFYKDPENEKAFREWKDRKEAKKNEKAI